MKCGLRWMVLAAVVLVSSNAWAVWNPDTDASLVFNMNFETYNNPAHTTTDADGGLVGTVEDYNTTYPNIFGETSIAGLGVDANFAALHDISIGAGIETVDGVQVSSPNDVKLTVPSNAVFELGYPAVKHTWTFWFNVPNPTQGTILRHANIYLAYEGYKDLLWEIRIFGGKLQFYHRNNSLRMETSSTLTELGLDVNTWHSAAVVIDRTNSIETSIPTTQLSTKIYVDGLEVPVIVTSLNNINMNIDSSPFYVSPLWIGAGEREFDGLLDDVRLFSRVLTPVEVSILNQPDKTNPVALLPIPRSENVVITTDVNWSPATGSVTAQKVYFGTDPCNLVLKKTTDGTTHIATNAELGGPLPFNTEYFWYVKSTISSVDSNGPLWSFTTETGKAINPSPVDGAEDVNLTGVDLSWTTPTAATYAVYLSNDRTLVETNDISVRLTDANSAHSVNDVDTSIRGATYYWRVNSTYTSGAMPGDIWSFRTKPYELVFNTSAAATTHADQEIPAYTCMLHSDGWTTVTTGSLATDGVAVFDFPSGFDYNDRYDIIVVPQLRARDIRVTEGNVPQPLAIHVTGNFTFDGRLQIAGDDILSTIQDNTYARSGGFPGPKHNQSESIFGDAAVPGNGDFAAYWTTYSLPSPTHTRFGTYTSSGHTIMVPTTLSQSTFGPGQPVNPPYKGGGGGGSGGIGGDAGRGYFFGIFSGGPSYGDKEAPVPFGGSSGGWGGSNSPGGAAGGGGIEIVATGNVTLDSNSQIRAWGGGQLSSAVNYPAGGGGGGCVKIIAGGSVTNKGNINVNGGKGGNGNQTNNTGGGGGGGRVAVFYGTTWSNTGIITADGGARGVTYADVCYSPSGLAQNGQNGTIFVTSGSPKKASAPTPTNGDKMVYCNPDPCTGFQLKWYSGYGGTTDVVYCDTFSPPTTSRGSVSATRGQHSVTMTVSSGYTYYMKVVTDGAVSSDTWSFKTVNWRCRQYDGTEDPNGGGIVHISGPEWDSNHDCVLNFNDFPLFGKDWFNPGFGQYMIDIADLDRFADEWLECSNRTDGGCAGY